MNPKHIVSITPRDDLGSFVETLFTGGETESVHFVKESCGEILSSIGESPIES